MKQRDRERELYRRRKAGKNEHVSAYNPVSHSRERAFTRAQRPLCARDGAETSSLGKWPAVPGPCTTTVKSPHPLGYPAEDRPLSGDRTSASQTQASRPFHPSLTGFSPPPLTLPPTVFLECTHVPRKRKRNESVAHLLKRTYPIAKIKNGHCGRLVTSFRPRCRSNPMQFLVYRVFSRGSFRYALFLHRRPRDSRRDLVGTGTAGKDEVERRRGRASGRVARLTSHALIGKVPSRVVKSRLSVTLSMREQGNANRGVVGEATEDRGERERAGSNG